MPEFRLFEDETGAAVDNVAVVDKASPPILFVILLVWWGMMICAWDWSCDFDCAVSLLDGLNSDSAEYLRELGEE